MLSLRKLHEMGENGAWERMLWQQELELKGERETGKAINQWETLDAGRGGSDKERGRA